jgi:hypothetical protein
VCPLAGEKGDAGYRGTVSGGAVHDQARIRTGHSGFRSQYPAVRKSGNQQFSRSEASSRLPAAKRAPVNQVLFPREGFNPGWLRSSSAAIISSSNSRDRHLLSGAQASAENKNLIPEATVEHATPQKSHCRQVFIYDELLAVRVLRRPEPDFLPPPDSLFTVDHALFCASSFLMPRLS